MRIIAGKARATHLDTPADLSIRPTSNRTRETLFNILEHGIKNFSLPGVRVLDLFAGTGTLGLEALSRGASFAVFIDDDAAARGLIRSNMERTHMNGNARISRRNAANLGPVGKYQKFDLVFADPPYRKGLGSAAAKSLVIGDWLNPCAIVVIEEAIDAEFSWPEKLTELDQRLLGKTSLHNARFDSDDTSSPA